MLIRYKIINKNSAWLSMGKITIPSVYLRCMHTLDNGNHIKLYIGERQGKILIFFFWIENTEFVGTMEISPLFF